MCLYLKHNIFLTKNKFHKNSRRAEMGPVVNNLSGHNQTFRCSRLDFTDYHLEKFSRWKPAREGITEYVSAIGSRAIKDKIEHTCSIKADGSFSASSTLESIEPLISSKFFASAGAGKELPSSPYLSSEKHVFPEATSQMATSAVSDFARVRHKPAAIVLKFNDVDPAIKMIFNAGDTIANLKKKLAEFFMKGPLGKDVRLHPESIIFRPSLDFLYYRGDIIANYEGMAFQIFIRLNPSSPELSKTATLWITGPEETTGFIDEIGYLAIKEAEAANQAAASATKEPVSFLIRFSDGSIIIKCEAGTTLGSVKGKFAELFIRELSTKGIRSVTVNPEDIDFRADDASCDPDELMDDLEGHNLRVIIEPTGDLDEHPTKILQGALKKLGWNGLREPSISLDLFTP